MERSTRTLTYSEIADSETRIGMRVGDILLTTALSDPIFRREMDRREILPGDFTADDGTGLFPETVIGRLQQIGGSGAAIRVLGLALTKVDSFESLNGDKEAVRDQMIFMEETLRKEYKLSKAKSASGEFLDKTSQK